MKQALSGVRGSTYVRVPELTQPAPRFRCRAASETHLGAPNLHSQRSVGSTGCPEGGACESSRTGRTTIDLAKSQAET